jgi:hypothetical protein
LAEQTLNPKTHLSPVEAPRQKPQSRYLQIRDLDKYQHYKNRNPPWVKLHGEQLDDYEFQQLPDAVKFHALALTYLAAKTGNKIPNDAAWVAAKIGARDPLDLPALMQIGFLEAWQPRLQEPGPGEQLSLPEGSQEVLSPSPSAASGNASKMLASCKHLASTETETETEGETEAHTETDTGLASGAGAVCVCCGLNVFSRFTLAEALSLTREWKQRGKIVGGRPVENPGGLARKLHIEGTADTEIAEFLHPPAEQEKRKFTAEPCTVCFGSKQEVVPGRGARPCPHCVDERGQRTGREPANLEEPR